MFEIGCDYEIVTLMTGENYEGKWGTYETSTVYEVASVDGPLVKLLGPDYSKINEILIPPGTDRNSPRDETIINTASLFFVRATKVQAA
ncbi:hypothetical protein [Rhizobium leguminosarum]|uniref:hypothetical protein n=1 Tax=Rhizobium leguminosarum TaxID=384 RepID=UPI00144165B7|nr:hypothetical protein [Rhizobium leguminosarum]NKL78877.1 hypothetical protein [Rhizobium leguminosarum bv. viciae]